MVGHRGGRPGTCAPATETEVAKHMRAGSIQRRSATTEVFPPEVHRRSAPEVGQAHARLCRLESRGTGVASTPEESAHTSLRARLSHCQANGTAESLHDDLSTLTRDPAQEAGLRPLPVDDDRWHGGTRPGLHEGLTLACYIRPKRERR